VSSGGYPPIAEHGVIGNLHTVALIATDGTVDWYCSPRFDSPSMFASLLDAERGGRFVLRPASGEWQNKQLYLPDTNVLGLVLIATAAAATRYVYVARRDGAATLQDAASESFSRKPVRRRRHVLVVANQTLAGVSYTGESSNRRVTTYW